MPSPATPGRAGTPSPPGQATSLPGWRASHWFNTPTPVELGDLRGRVVLVHAFQMLCPACVSHGLPQALRVHEAFQGEAVTVIGLHTVFEHHEVMGSQALQAFIQEYRLPFPIGIDQAAEAGPLPVTMAQWGLNGTPSVVLFDRQGRARLHRFRGCRRPGAGRSDRAVAGGKNTGRCVGVPRSRRNWHSTASVRRRGLCFAIAPTFDRW
jgi:peroxiredoxin